MQQSAAASPTGLSIPSLQDRNAWLLVLLLVLVPNLFLLLTVPFYVLVRPISPLLYLGAGLVSLRTNPMLTFPLFLLAGAIDLILIVAIAFHLPFDLAIDSARYLASIDVAASLFYVSTILLFIVNSLVAAWLLNRHRSTVRSVSILPAVMVALALTLIERQINAPFTKHENPVFQSALSINGLDAKSVSANGRNLLVVMVEGLGAYKDPAMARHLSERLSPALKTGRFDLVEGLSNFKGSTTGAESRELCGKWGDHNDYLSAPHYDCLPAQLAGAGYETTSFHGFSSTMFARDAWYPSIGFQERHFFEDLSKDTAMFKDRCGSVFVGLCDKDFAPVLANRLKMNGDKPKFVYWLTLTSHIPYVPKSPGNLGCGTAKAKIANKRVCELTDIWADVFDTVAALANDQDLPPVDILLVGDHSTPLWEKPAAALFQPGKVQWYLLKSRNAATASIVRSAGDGGIHIRPGIL
jgi:hypothetical protein